MSVLQANVGSGSPAEILTSRRCGPLLLRQLNSYCIREKVRSRANKRRIAPVSLQLQQRLFGEHGKFVIATLQNGQINQSK
jgi:hypothetical protein